jgi:hypothetical protein
MVKGVVWPGGLSRKLVDREQSSLMQKMINTFRKRCPYAFAGGNGLLFFLAEPLRNSVEATGLHAGGGLKIVVLCHL